MSAGRVVVHVPAQLRQLFGASPEEVVAATSVREALAALDARYPGIRARILEPDGRPRAHVNLFVAEAPVRLEPGADVPLGTAGRLWIIPAVSGG